MGTCQLLIRLGHDFKGETTETVVAVFETEEQVWAAYETANLLDRSTYVIKPSIPMFPRHSATP